MRTKRCLTVLLCLLLRLVASEENNGRQFRCRAANEDGWTDSKIAVLKLK